MWHSLSISDLVGKTLTEIHHNGSIILTVSPDEVYEIDHYQDCCESVELESVDGNLADLLNTPILAATEDNPDLPIKASSDECFEWTRQVFQTSKGSVTFLWYGTSNGYYGMSVNLTRKESR